MGITALSRVQMGVMASMDGSTDIPTTWWMGEGFLKDNTQVVRRKQNVGRLGGNTNTFIPKRGGEITLLGGATYQQLPYLFNSAIKHVDPTTDASAAKIRTWDVQATDTDPISSSDLDFLVIEGGDNQQAEIMRSGFVTEYTLSGSAGAGLDISAKVEGRTISKTTFTASLSQPTVEDVLVSLGAMYIDPSTDTPGTTLKSNTLFDFSLKHTTGWKAQHSKDNRLDYSFVKRVGDDMTLDVTFEHNTNAVTEKDFWLAQTERVIRITFLGSALSSTDAGATYDTLTFAMNLYGKWESWDVLSEKDGNNVINGVFRIGYSELAGKSATMIVVNESATLP